ncbi:MAG: hypothetical protein WC805_01325 [Patescibacteria group bacterium]|jgi:hypothetical protein
MSNPISSQKFKEHVKLLLQQYKWGLLSQEEVAREIMAIPRERLVREDAKYIYDDTDIGRIFDIAWEYDVPPEHRKEGWGDEWKELNQIIDQW